MGEQCEFTLTPGIGRPPLLVPASRRAAAAAVRHYSGPRSRPVRLATKAVSLGLASGFAGSVPRGWVRVEAPPGTDTIETHLRCVLGRDDVFISMYLGPARANRKPVLQLLTRDGTPVAFAKVGINPLTNKLVHAEAASLARLGEAGSLRIKIPDVVHYGTWRELNVLVLSVLSVWQRRKPAPSALLAKVMDEVAGIAGLSQAPLGESGYIEELRVRLRTAEHDASGQALAQVLDVVADRAKDTVLSFGAWHGDWTPWNMASTVGGLLVWDWERFTAGVPLGYDALHYWLQRQVGPGHRDPAAAAASCPAQAPRLLAPFAVPPREARLTAILYLVDLAARYLVDRQAEAGALHGAPGAWLIPAAVAEAGRL